LIEGDGIGPEITAATVRATDAVIRLMAPAET
jgi:isocitrate/isopropylmalate dehydrogenase